MYDSLVTAYLPPDELPANLSLLLAEEENTTLPKHHGKLKIILDQENNLAGSKTPSPVQDPLSIFSPFAKTL